MFMALLSACGESRLGEVVTQDEVLALTSKIADLDPSIDRSEAARAAEIALTYPSELAELYEITDPPLLHNIKVNAGVKPRGLCYHWADDMEARLAREGFETLKLHRAIANFENALRIEHSTVIVSGNSQGMFEGVVLDPWRFGGRLWWGKVREDPKYVWRPRQEVFDAKRERRGG